MGGPKGEVVWQACAYPRAYYYLGFLRVKQKRGAEAVSALEAGLKLEPTSAILRLELGNALRLTGDASATKRMAAEILELGDEVLPGYCAAAMRAIGFALIDEGQLDKAERWFMQSLEIDPGSSVAKNGLKYIATLRQGGPRAKSGLVATDQAVTPTACTLCSGTPKPISRIVRVDGEVHYACETCIRRLERPWWKFW